MNLDSDSDSGYDSTSACNECSDEMQDDPFKFVSWSCTFVFDDANQVWLRCTVCRSIWHVECVLFHFRSLQAVSEYLEMVKNFFHCPRCCNADTD